MESYLSITRLNEKIVPKIDDNFIEMGTGFQPIEKGKTTAIKVKLPAKNNYLRVTIWDNDLAVKVREEYIIVPTANAMITKDIPDLDLVKGKQYTISMNTKDWFQYSRLNDANLTYPYVIGNILILNYKQYITTNQFFPTNEFSAFYTGDLSFDFQRTE